MRMPCRILHLPPCGVAPLAIQTGRRRPHNGRKWAIARLLDRVDRRCYQNSILRSVRLSARNMAVNVSAWSIRQPLPAIVMALVFLVLGWGLFRKVEMRRRPIVVVARI